MQRCTAQVWAHNACGYMREQERARFRVGRVVCVSSCGGSLAGGPAFSLPRCCKKALAGLSPARAFVFQSSVVSSWVSVLRSSGPMQLATYSLKSSLTLFPCSVAYALNFSASFLYNLHPTVNKFFFFHAASVFLFFSFMGIYIPLSSFILPHINGVVPVKIEQLDRVAPV